LTSTREIAARADGDGAMPDTHLKGSVVFLMFYDVCEEIRLPEVREILKAQPPGREPSFKHTAPEYVRFERPPVVESLEDFTLSTGEPLRGRIMYYDYGVAVVELVLPFAGGWGQLIDLASRYVSGSEIERHTFQLARQHVSRVTGALTKPYENWLSEDYFIFHVVEIDGQPTAAQVLAAYPNEIAQIVRGENAHLADAERNEILQSAMSYYPTDLAVIGWNGAFVYDTAAGGETTIQLLEYANSQLLEFRYYDEVLTRRLQEVYQILDRGTGFFARWRLARAASRLYTMLLDVTELTERTDNSIKFLSDMFSARLYRLAAAKVGVPDYRNLVERKLRTADSLYRFMVEQFNQARAFALELLVVVILIIELVALFFPVQH
jgi:hypothetical protein